MSLFAISDLHLSLSSDVDKPMDVFDYAWVNHVSRLENGWRKLVSVEDTVLIPGDISWGLSLEQAMPDLAFIDSLPGKKVLLRGNHDYWWASMKKMRSLFPSVFFVQNDCYAAEDFVVAGSRGWTFPWDKNADFTPEENDKIYKRELLRLEMSLQAAAQAAQGRPLIAATHYPPLSRDHMQTEFTRLYQKYGVQTAVYGHLHGAKQAFAAEGPSDGINYRLVSLDKLDAVPLKIL